MGVDYTSGGLFGAFAKRDTAAHETLAKMFADSDGEVPVFDAVPGVSIARHGNSYSGTFDYAIRQTGGAEFTSRAGGYSGPFTLSDAKPDAIQAAIMAPGLSPDDFEPTGFYLYLDVW